jgi:hypothetical protein
MPLSAAIHSTGAWERSAILANVSPRVTVYTMAGGSGAGGPEGGGAEGWVVPTAGGGP